MDAFTWVAVGNLAAWTAIAIYAIRKNPRRKSTAITIIILWLIVTPLQLWIHWGTRLAIRSLPHH